MKKRHHQVFRVEGISPKRKLTYMEFGWIENPTFNNDIYIDIISAHKGGDGFYEIRTDEALVYIQGLAIALNAKNGINLKKLT